MRVLVCGGRDYDNQSDLYMTLDRMHRSTPITLVIHGGASGADSWAGQWALSRKVPVLECPADWPKYGRQAGPLRNAEMLKHEPDHVVAFPGGRGTADMVRKAKRAGVNVIEVKGTP